jgi:long-chain-acyl-CoA dehydrogenase
MSTAAPPRRALFDDEHDDYRDSFRRFVAAEVKPHYDRWSRDGIVPRELFTKMAAHGFLAMEVAEEHGGSGVGDWRFNAVVMEEAWWADCSAALLGPILHTDTCLPYLTAAMTEEQAARWMPGVASGERILAIAMTEPGTGSDLAGIATRARRDGEEYVLYGAKTFITNGINADLVIVAARTGADPHRGLSLIVAERGTPGFERGSQIEKLGQHASDTAELFFDCARVPVANRLGEEGSGFLQLVSRLVPERLSIAVGATAGCERALDLTLAYVKDRRAFGQPIGQFQNTRFALAELRTEIELLRCFVDRTIERYMAGTATPAEAAMAKLKATELLGQATDLGVQLHGGYGYTTEYAIGRQWVDARVTRIYAGANEIMKELIGRSMGL